jgi:hypothetical protein
MTHTQNWHIADQGRQTGLTGARIGDLTGLVTVAGPASHTGLTGALDQSDRCPVSEINQEVLIGLDL